MVLSLDSHGPADQDVVVSYTDPTTDDTDAIQDPAGNDAADLVIDQAVTNNRPRVGDERAPQRCERAKTPD